MKTDWLKLVIVLLVVGIVGSVAAVSWTGGGDDDLWTNGDNWDTGVAPDETSTLGDTIYISGSAYSVLIDSDVTVVNDILGPEWGATLTIDGGSLTQLTTGSPDYYGWRLAPVSNILYDPPSTINVVNGGNLSSESNLCIGDNWWWSAGYYVDLNIYDTSTVYANYAFLGGHLNIYGGTVTFDGLDSLDDNGYVCINIEEGELILTYGDVTADINNWIAAGKLTAYGLTPGDGADIIIDTTTTPGSTIVTAVYSNPARNPSVTPLNANGTVGTLVGTEPPYTVNATLHWWAGADPNEAVNGNPLNPDILTHYIYLSNGATDPNLYYVDSVAQTSLTDPNASYALTGLSENTVYYWRIDEGLNDGTDNAYSAGDPNNISGQTWSFLTKASTPVITADPVNAVANPDASFTIEDDGVATGYEWYKVGTATPLSDTGAYSGTGTATLTVTNASIAEEGQYYCVAINGTNTDTSASAYLWTQRLMGHWEFEQNLDDSVTPAHNGTIGTNTVAGPGDPNYAVGGGLNGNDAIQFFNDGDYVAIDDADFFNFYPLGFTVSFWYKENAQLGWKLPLSKLDDGVGGWLFGIDAESREWALFFTNPDDAVENWADGYMDVNEDGQNDINIGDGQWHMITAVYDPTDTTYTIFTDGDENESIVLDLSANTLPTNPLSIGGIVGESSIDGFIDDVQIYSYVLTPLEIAQLYVAIETDKWVCVEDPENPLNAFDLTHDCVVSLADFAEFAAKWLECQRYPADKCSE